MQIAENDPKLDQSPSSDPEGPPQLLLKGSSGSQVTGWSGLLLDGYCSRAVHNIIYCFTLQNTTGSLHL